MLAAAKMTSANLALIMAPNLLRCGSNSMAVVPDRVSLYFARGRTKELSVDRSLIWTWQVRAGVRA